MKQRAGKEAKSASVLDSHWYRLTKIGYRPIIVFYSAVRHGV